MEKKPKKPGRPSKLSAELSRKARRLAELGLSDEQLACALDVSHKTLENWKKLPEFAQLLQAGKDVADEKVVVALFRRACGYSHPEDKIFQFEGSPVIVPTVRHYPPDTNAAIFWLTNRRSEEWSNRQKTEISGNLAIEVVDYASCEQAHKAESSA